MSKENREAERKLRLLGDRLRLAAEHADELDLKPEAKAALLEQFGPDKQSPPGGHAANEHQRRKPKKGGDDLPPH